MPTKPTPTEGRAVNLMRLDSCPHGLGAGNECIDCISAALRAHAEAAAREAREPLEREIETLKRIACYWQNEETPKQVADATRKAYEDACTAQCRRCAGGASVSRSDDGTWWHDVWPCDAFEIRERMKERSAAIRAMGEGE
jgi:hypothetical protein